MSTLKRLWAWAQGWRTMIVAASFASIDVIDVYTGVQYAEPLIPHALMPLWTMLHPIAFAYLRYISTTPLGSREPPIGSSRGGA